ncbi:UNVERIFIED_ORG: hypothetical protein ABIB21_003300 [Arthrobacter sp. UYEF13]
MAGLMGPAPADLRTAVVAAHRQLTPGVGGLGMGTGMMRLTINGRIFNASRTDTVVAAQTVEEWTLLNPRSRGPGNDGPRRSPLVPRPTTQNFANEPSGLHASPELQA